MNQPVPRKAPETLHVQIDGMTCAACSGRIERKLNGVPGVEARVNLATAMAEIHLDPQAPASKDVLDLIEDLGYPPQQAQVELAVGDMTCAACSGRVERALNRLDGVVEASVNLATGRADVRYLPAMLSVDDLVQAVEQAGYPASVPEAHAGSESHDASARLQTMRRDVVLAFVLSAPVLVLAMGADFVPALRRGMEAVAPVPSFWGWVQALLTTAVLAGPGRRFYRAGWQAWRHMTPDMNALVMTGTGAAWLYSMLVLLVPGWFPPASLHLYFEAAAVVVSIVLLGKYLEEKAKQSTAGALRKLIGLQADTAHRVDEGGNEHSVPVSRLHPGERVRVRAGERMPVDGTVLEGEAWLDVSMLTGEPMPRAVRPGDEVQAGTLVDNGLLLVRVDRLGRDTLLAQIIRMVEQAQAGKLPIQQLADRVVRVFSPIVLAIALVTFLAWLLLGPDPALNHALVASVAVLVIACPCAMGLATPAAILVGTGRAAELGVLFRNGQALEHLTRVREVLMDKTGTLTQGRPRVVEVVADAPDDSLALAAALEAGSTHPLARAVLDAAGERGLVVSDVDAFENLPGRGVRGQVQGRDCSLGNRRMMQESGVDTGALEVEASRLAEQGHTVVWLAWDGQAQALLAIADPPREEARAVVERLHTRGIRVTLVTGDQPVTARHVARQLGIDRVHADVLPSDKARIVAEARRQCTDGLVAFVGDGINDAPALAEADVGLAMGGGTDIAVESADVVLMRPGLHGLIPAIEASRATLRTIRGNLFWAFVYNIVLIPVAAGVFWPWTGWMLNPMLAGAAMGFSSLFVLGNSLRLKRLIGDP